MYTKNILLIGYWPPTNIMLKQFSRSPRQNEGDYRGLNWEGLGYNIFAFFPDFEDGDVFTYDRSGPTYPVGTGNFKVDYQDTLRDFNWCVQYYKPCAIISFSRMGDWEEIVLEPGHMVCEEWAPDMNPPSQPNKSLPYRLNYFTGLGEAGSWLSQSLPRDKIVEVATANDDLEGLRIRASRTTETIGDFLSNYIGALGAKYRADHGYVNRGYQCRASGHVHVGGGTPVEKVKLFSEIALRETIKHIDRSLNSIWIYSIALRLAQSTLPDSGTMAKIKARFYRDDVLFYQAELDWGDRGDFLMPGNEHMHIMSFGDRRRDPSAEYPDAAAPRGGIEFANGVHGHLRVELENPSNDLWRSGLVEVLVRETKQVMLDDGDIVWRTDPDPISIYSSMSSTRLATGVTDVEPSMTVTV